MRYTEYSDLKKCKGGLGNCSFDSEHNERMCESDLQVINFDKVKTSYCNQRGLTEEKAHSVDAIVNGPDDYTCMIEFKNGKIKNARENVQLKLRDSILILCDLCHCNISNTRENLIFVLVYNDERSNLGWETKRYIGMKTLSTGPVKFWDLGKAEGFLVRKVMVLSKEQFSEKFLPKLREA